jgi:hypothetical protein
MRTRPIRDMEIEKTVACGARGLFSMNARAREILVLNAALVLRTPSALRQRSVFARLIWACNLVRQTMAWAVTNYRYC